MKNIQLLDCTLRDGGQGLEDLYKNGVNTKGFTENEKEQIIKSLSQSKVDIIELGCMAENEKDFSRFGIYHNIEELSCYVPKKKSENQLYVGLYIGPDTDLDKIPVYQDGLIEGVRVILRYSELTKSLDYCEALAKKGYKVFIQPMLTMRYSDSELELLIERANKIKAYALYFVDSYGYMNENDIKRIYDFYNSRLDKDIRIGFHAHNNMQMALSNVKFFLSNNSSSRKVIVDSCAIGMGQGAGNLQTELAVDLMNSFYGKEYIFEDVLDVCEVIEKFREYEMETWGYSPVRAVSAINKAAYKYAVDMRIHKKMTLSEIHKVFLAMPDELKSRYTVESMEKVIELVRKSR